MKDALIRNHAAVDEFMLVVESVPASGWATKAAPERWTAAQQVNHIVLSYRAIVHDVRDGRHAHLIGTPAQRRRWRWLGLSQVLYLGHLPHGAPAPREIRPPDYSPDRVTLLRELRSALDDFERTMRGAARDRAGHRVAHPYFGWISLRQAVRVCEVHTRHHTAALARGADRGAAGGTPAGASAPDGIPALEPVQHFGHDRAGRNGLD